MNNWPKCKECDHYFAPDTIQAKVESICKNCIEEKKRKSIIVNNEKYMGGLTNY